MMRRWWIGVGMALLLAALAGCAPGANPPSASREAALAYLGESGDLLVRALGATEADADFDALYDRQKALRPASGDAALQRFQRDMLSCYAAARALQDDAAAVERYAMALVEACELLTEEAIERDAIGALRAFAVKMGAVTPPGSLTVPHDRMMGDLTHAIQAYDDLEAARAIDDPLMESAAADDMNRDALLIAEDTELLRDAIEKRYEEIDAQMAAMESAWRIQDRSLGELKELYIGERE